MAWLYSASLCFPGNCFFSVSKFNMNIVNGLKKIYLSSTWITEYIRDFMHFVFCLSEEDNFLLYFTLDIIFSLPRITALFVALHFQKITVKYTAAKNSETWNSSFNLLVSWILSWILVVQLQIQFQNEKYTLYGITSCEDKLIDQYWNLTCIGH